MQDARWTIQVELRSLNSRHFKLSARISEPYNGLESELEHLIRGRVRRGVVQASLRIERPRRPDDYRLNLVALASYRDQLARFQGREAAALEVTSLLGLPGVVEELRTDAVSPAQDWPQIAAVVAEALDRLDAARSQEGSVMAEELMVMLGEVENRLSRVDQRRPLVVQAHHQRMLERIRATVQEQGITLEDRDLIREVAILADRLDVSEELLRLKAHLEQFREILREEVSAGRKLEFIVQEIGREVNTIGSKANDVEISREIVEIKATLEKIRELVQNVE